MSILISDSLLCLFIHIAPIYMTITKYLYTFQDGNDGFFPVMIKIEHNGISRMIPTDVTCRIDNWLPNACQVSPDDACHIVKNETIDAQLRRVAGRIQNNIDNFLLNNLDHILNSQDLIRHDRKNEKPAVIRERKCFLQLIDTKINSLINVNTRRGYMSFRRYFYSKYNEGPDTADIDKKFINSFDMELKKDFKDNKPTRHLMLSRMRAVINLARENGDIPQPLSFKLPKVPFHPKDRNLSDSSILTIFDTFNKLLQSDPIISQPTTFALSLFILDIAFQGLAPVDLASLKIKHLNRHTVYPPAKETGSSPIETIVIRTSRQKTGQQVMIVAAWQPLKKILEMLMKEKSPEDYLIPCFKRYENLSPEQHQNRLANYFHMLSKNLNKVLTIIGIDRDETGEKRTITFYYARHAFCNLVDSLDVPRHIIQHMIGHRTTVLETNYLRRITPWEQALLSQKILSSLDQTIT